MKKEMKQELTLRITQANKTEMIVILYEMLLIYVQDSIDAHEIENRAEFREGIRKAGGCIKELMSSLNFESELANIILQLYIYANKELIRADIRNQVEPLKHVAKIIKELHEAYSKSSQTDTSDSLMENAQSVYAGLTYGRKHLNENLSDQGTNRGFLV